MIRKIISKISHLVKNESSCRAVVVNDVNHGCLQGDREHLLKSVEGYTMSSFDRLNKLIDLAEYCNSAGIQGDFVECGSFKGGSSAVLSRYLDNRRHLWIYDSFEGMPETTDKDGDTAKECVGLCAARPEDVIDVMNKVDTDPTQYTITAGWFIDTFCGKLPETVALLHCDADWYESVMLVLETFYDRIPDGGCIILDDFGFWEGCREAFYDFCYRRGEKPLLERVGTTQAYWIKGKRHTRVGWVKGVTGADI